MTGKDWIAINKLIADCKKSGGRELDLVELTLQHHNDALLIDEVLHRVAGQLPDLESIGLYVEGAARIVGVLAKHVEHMPKLQALDLLVQGDVALQALAKRVENLPPIRSLGLGAISNAGLMAISNQAEKFGGLRHIEFDECSFGDQTLHALAARAKDLVNLEGFCALYSESLRVSEKGASVLKNFAGLKALLLEAWPVGDAWLAKFVSQARPFTNLKALCLSLTGVGDDGVKALVKHAENFPNLERLDLRSTMITDDGLKALALAWEEGSFPNLESLDVGGTNVRCVRPEVCKTESARQIFEAVLDGLTMPVAKVVVLGEPGVGKTSLCRRLFLGRCIADTSRRRETHDFELITPNWRPRIRDLNVQLRVWDFGGQHVLHGTHEIFLTSSSVCLLARDATQVKDRDPKESDGERDGNRLPYWLKMIRHFVGEDAPVILVVTKCDQRDEDLRTLDAEKLQIEHGFTTPIEVVDGFSATEKSRKGPVNDLEQAITNALEQMEDLHSRVPREFVGLKDRVEHEVTNRALFKLEEYRTWCREAGIHKNRDQDTYLRTLHHFGSVFYFGLLDFEKKKLEDFRHTSRRGGSHDLPPGQIRLLTAERDSTLGRWLINPRWLKHPVYALIRESERQRLLTEQHIQNAVRQSAKKFDLDDLTVAGDVLRGVLKLIELCFHDRGRYFFPRGLPDDSSSYLTGWDARHEVTWRWGFFPEAVIHRFIVQAYQHHEWYRDAQWRTGAVLHSGETRVAVKSHPESGDVTVWLKRPDNKVAPAREDQEFLERLKHRLRDLIGRDPDETIHSWNPEAPVSVDNKSPDHAAEACATTTADTEAKPSLGGLSPHAEKAYRSFEYAATKMECQPKDREAYDWLKDHGHEDYKLPDFETWSNYVRKGRRHYGTSKNSPRTGRLGRSIVSRDEL